MALPAVNQAFETGSLVQRLEKLGDGSLFATSV
jgi:hypothetical protein